MRIALLLALVLATVAGRAAEPAGVYESLDRVRLGRLFTSGLDREALERRRAIGVRVDDRLNNRSDNSPQDPVSDSNQDGTTTAARETSVDPRRASGPSGAGIIQRKEGRPLVWRAGRFVPDASASPDTVRFPARTSVLPRAMQGDDSDPDSDVAGEESETDSSDDGEC